MDGVAGMSGLRLCHATHPRSWRGLAMEVASPIWREQRQGFFAPLRMTTKFVGPALSQFGRP